jgi:hypothetical protein
MHPFASPSFTTHQVFREICESAQVANLLLMQNSKLLKQALTIASSAVSSSKHIPASILLIGGRWTHMYRPSPEDIEQCATLKLTTGAARHAALSSTQAALEIRGVIGNQNSPLKQYFKSQPKLQTTMISTEEDLARVHRHVLTVLRETPSSKELAVVERKIFAMCNAARLNTDIAKEAVVAVEQLQREVICLLRMVERI